MEKEKDFLDEHIEIIGGDEKTKKKLMEMIRKKIGEQNESKSINRTGK
jgi:hypothetical protein